MNEKSIAPQVESDSVVEKLAEKSIASETQLESSFSEKQVLTADDAERRKREELINENFGENAGNLEVKKL